MLRLFSSLTPFSLFCVTPFLSLTPFFVDLTPFHRFDPFFSGLDLIFRNRTNGRLAVTEAKGGTNFSLKDVARDANGQPIIDPTLGRVKTEGTAFDQFGLVEGSRLLINDRARKLRLAANTVGNTQLEALADELIAGTQRAGNTTVDSFLTKAGGARGDSRSILQFKLDTFNPQSFTFGGPRTLAGNPYDPLTGRGNIFILDRPQVQSTRQELLNLFDNLTNAQ